MSNLKRGSKGFTLIELMVVMGILALLMAIVFPAMTGVKATGIESQAVSDANSAQKALDRFNNQSIVAGQFPEATLLTGYATEYAKKTVVTLVLTDTTEVLLNATTAVYPSGTTEARTAIDWEDTINVWQTDGTVNEIAFVPDLMSKEPQSYLLEGDEVAGTAHVSFHEFLWLLRVNESGSADESRTVEVFRLTVYTPNDPLTADVDETAFTYTQIY